MKTSFQANTAEASNEAGKIAIVCQHEVIGHETAARGVLRQTYCKMDKHPRTTH